jgi:hypothetical protein
MPRVPVHTVESAPEGSRDDLKALESRFGKVLNIFGEMGPRPRRHRPVHRGRGHDRGAHVA